MQRCALAVSEPVPASCVPLTHPSRPEQRQCHSEAPGITLWVFREPGSAWLTLGVDVQLQILACPPSSPAAGSAVPGPGSQPHTRFPALSE